MPSAIVSVVNRALRTSGSACDFSSLARLAASTATSTGPIVGEQVAFGVGPYFAQHGGIVWDNGPQAYSLGGKHPANLAHRW